jgi:thiamine pyrophosphate-dependent acetolactate synthase large subunit-like protein
LLTGLWDAHVDRDPVLALTDQVNPQVLGPGAFQEIDQASAFQAEAAWSQTVLTTSNHAELMTLALKHAVVERRVGHLIFPDELQVLPVPKATASSPQARLGELAISPATESIGQAVDLMANSKHPAIIVGYGARESMDEVTALADQINATILTTSRPRARSRRTIRLRRARQQWHAHSQFPDESGGPLNRVRGALREPYRYPSNQAHHPS